MAIHKRVHRHDNNQISDAALPVFSYPATDDLATVVIDAWINGSYTYTDPAGHQVVVQNLRKALLERDDNGDPTPKAVEVATARIKDAGIDLTRAVVISEEEHDTDYYMKDDLEVVFVLPRAGRLQGGPPPPPPVHPFNARLLATAKLLMSCTPNGI